MKFLLYLQFLSIIFLCPSQVPVGAFFILVDSFISPCYTSTKTKVHISYILIRLLCQYNENRIFIRTIIRHVVVEAVLWCFMSITLRKVHKILKLKYRYYFFLKCQYSNFIIFIYLKVYSIYNSICLFKITENWWAIQL